jgi:hypothetical protein
LCAGALSGGNPIFQGRLTQKIIKKQFFAPQTLFNEEKPCFIWLFANLSARHTGKN